MNKVIPVIAVLVFGLVGVSEELYAADISKTNTALSEAASENSYDYVDIKKNGVVRGEILNKTFTLLTILGKLEFPASKVHSATVQKGSTVRLSLVDGQIYTGMILDKNISLRMTIGELREIKFSELKSFAYRTDGDKSKVPKLQGAYIRDKKSLMKFSPADNYEITFSTVHGNIKMPFEHVVSARHDAEKKIWLLSLSNGSILHGSLVLGKIDAELLPLDGNSIYTTFEGELITELSSGAVVNNPGGLAKIVTISGDKILGRPLENFIEIMSPTGAVRISLMDIISVKFNTIDPNRVTLNLWGNREIEGRILSRTFPVDIQPCGVEIPVLTERISSIMLAGVLESDRFAGRIRQAVKDLGSKDANRILAAQKTLTTIGSPAEKVLREIANESDPVLSARIMEIIEGFK